MSRARDLFATVRTEGGILPADLLARLAAGDQSLEGSKAEDYHLAPGERINEAITRAWNRLTTAWANFRTASGRLSEGDAGTSLTRERWLLVLFQELGYGRLPTNKSSVINGKEYPISHLWQQVPIHLVGFRVDLDRRTPGVAGASRTSPHGLMQEFLNRSGQYSWGFVSNGLRLRLLRDNANLTRQAYVEFDLEAMMEGEIYADFVLLWLLCHESRVDAPDVKDFWLERWMHLAQEQGTRALDGLREGVEKAIVALGQGFLSYPGNSTLRDRLRSGDLSTQDYYRQLLRLVYRLIFLFVAEDRRLLFDPGAQAGAVERYLKYYSVGRLRHLAELRRGTPHADLYRGLKVVMERLGSDQGCPELGLPALGSFLWSSQGLPELMAADLSNRSLLDAIRALAFMVIDGLQRAIDYRNLGSEELGSVYESLLELHPELDVDAGAFQLTTVSGHERKTTGSYYTPSSLIQCLLDSALDPVLDEAAQKADPEASILSLKVCDPACGSGHFLIGAAHRIARRLASVKTGDDEPSPEATRAALRDTIGHCLYGVDVNPMAVELCKVGLWMEALVPGKPLTFLDHHVVVGNSLLGATPTLIAGGIPDGAFVPLEGDDRKVVASLKRQNREEAKGQSTLFAGLARLHGSSGNTFLAASADYIDQISDDTISGVREKEAQHRATVKSAEYEHAKLVADAWCAAFVWRKSSGSPLPITYGLFRQLQEGTASIPEATLREVNRLAERYGFLHWHLVFPDVFRTAPGNAAASTGNGWVGGFDVVLGNPPWERVKLQEQEWFALRRPDIAAASNAAARRRLIQELEQEDPSLHEAFIEAKHEAEGESHLIRNSGKYPLTGRGDVNTYAVFAETMRMLIAETGRVGAIVPSGIATDDTTKLLFQDLMEKRALVSLLDFENRKRIFPAVDSRMKFSLLTLVGPARPSTSGAEFVFFAHQVDDLNDPERRYTISREEIALLNPNTRTSPIFRSKRDAEITKGIYQRVPVLIREAEEDGNPWGMTFLRMIDMTNDSGLFRSRRQLEAAGGLLKGNVFFVEGESFLPLYEAKMIHQFDHRWATHEAAHLREVTTEEKQSESLSVIPRYWVKEADVDNRLRRFDREGRPVWEWTRGWLVGWRDVTNSTNERTVIASVLPRTGVANNFPLMFVEDDNTSRISLLVANLNSLVLDFVARTKVGGMHLNFFVYQQLPVLPPSIYQKVCPWAPNMTVEEWMFPRAIELLYTASDLRQFAEDVGVNRRPFIWDEHRRFLLRSELDAAFFHLYGVTREDAAHILSTFPITRQSDMEQFGKYRTEEAVLQHFDGLSRAIKGLAG